MKRTIGAITMAAVGGLLPLAPTAGAKDGDVRVAGSCTKATSSKLKLSEEDGRIEVEFEVDQNRNGVRWTVVLARNGTAGRASHRASRAARAARSRRAFVTGTRRAQTGSSPGPRGRVSAAPPRRRSPRRVWRDGPRRQGAAGRREARTQGALISADMGATEDNASRRSGAPLGTSRLFRQALLAVVPEHVGSSGSPWRLRAAKHSVQGGHRMKLHRNAALSWSGRRRLAERVVVEGWTLRAAAEAAGVSVRCARKWVARYRLEGERGLTIAPRRRGGSRIAPAGAGRGDHGLRRLASRRPRSPRRSGWRSRPSPGS